jgi:hypothetical protein
MIASPGQAVPHLCTQGDRRPRPLQVSCRLAGESHPDDVCGQSAGAYQVSMMVHCEPGHTGYAAAQSSQNSSLITNEANSWIKRINLKSTAMTLQSQCRLSAHPDPVPRLMWIHMDISSCSYDQQSILLFKAVHEQLFSPVKEEKYPGEQLWQPRE